ncbi:MAG: DUF2971 domain-containing protein [Xanthobacteraceae bacterium]
MAGTSDLRDYWAAYAVSFSAQEDDLSQWRAYAQGVGGFAIGCELKRPHLMRSIFEGSESSDPWMLFKVVYDKDTQRQSFEYVIKGIVDIFRSKRQNIQNHFLANLINKLCQRTRLLLADCLLSFKNPAFQKEKEWRLVFLGDKAFRQSDMSVVNYRNTQFGLIPYVEYKTPTLDNLLPIGVVIQGSRVEPKLSAEAVQGYLIRYGYTYANVRQTAVRLR